MVPSFTCSASGNQSHRAASPVGAVQELVHQQCTDSLALWGVASYRALRAPSRASLSLKMAEVWWSDEMNISVFLSLVMLFDDVWCFVEQLFWNVRYFFLCFFVAGIPCAASLLLWSDIGRWADAGPMPGLLDGNFGKRIRPRPGWGEQVFAYFVGGDAAWLCNLCDVEECTAFRVNLYLRHFGTF